MLDISDIKQYIAKYEKADSKELVDEGVDAFLQNHGEWKQAIERIYGTDRGDEIYGDAFVVFTVCLFKSERLVDNLADYVSKEIRDYESKVDYPFGNMYSLFFNMGLIWHKLGTMYDDNAVEKIEGYGFEINGYIICL